MMSPELREIIFDRKVARLTRDLGSRVVAHLLRRLGQKHMIRTSIDIELDEILTRIDPEMLAATGGDVFPQPPLLLCPSRRDGGGAP